MTQSLEGEPKEMISGLAVTDNNYNLAVGILKDHYKKASEIPLAANPKA